MLVEGSVNPIRSRATRVVGITLTLLCLGAQLASLAHLALVRHVACAEHGDAMDAPEPSESDSHARHSPSPGDAGLAFAPGEPHEGQSHEHCPLAENRNAWALVVDDPIASSCEALPTAIAPPRARIAGLSPSALRLLAPKTSPPV